MQKRRLCVFPIFWRCILLCRNPHGVVLWLYTRIDPSMAFLLPLPPLPPSKHENAGLISGQHLRRFANIKPALVQRLVINWARHPSHRQFVGITRFAFLSWCTKKELIGILWTPPDSYWPAAWPLSAIAADSNTDHLSTMSGINP